MEEIVRVHYPDVEDNLLKSAMEVFYNIRALRDIRKKPSTSELIDWHQNHARHIIKPCQAAAAQVLGKRVLQGQKFSQRNMQSLTPKAVKKFRKHPYPFLRWLDKSELQELADEEARAQLNELEDLQVHMDKEEVEQKFRERLRDQDSEHNGGSFWIGSMGKTSFGNSGEPVSLFTRIMRAT